jgi:hypothetical protein
MHVAVHAQAMFGNSQARLRKALEALGRLGLISSVRESAHSFLDFEFSVAATGVLRLPWSSLPALALYAICGQAGLDSCLPMAQAASSCRRA